MMDDDLDVVDDKMLYKLEILELSVTAPVSALPPDLSGQQMFIARCAVAARPPPHHPSTSLGPRPAFRASPPAPGSTTPAPPSPNPEKLCSTCLLGSASSLAN